jgi:PAS domain S-box-containing protein
MDNIPDAIYFKDLQSRFLRCTKSQCGTFHVENTDQLIGKSDFDFFTAEHAQRAFDDEQKIIRTGQPIIGLVEKETWPDGSVTWVSTTKMPLRNEKGETIGTFGISRDITSVKRAEAENERIHQQLMVASRQAGMAEVATSVLHNVGNVLNSVNVSASLISETIRNSRAQAIQKIFALLRENESQLGPFFSQHDKGKLVMSYLDGLTKQVAQERQQLMDEIGSLTKDVEHIKEIVAMQQNYAQVSGVIEKTKASDLVEDALRLNHESLVRHDVELVRQFDVDPEMLVEKHKVLQILVNLIRNAKQACKAAGRTHKHLTVKITQGDSGRVRIGVVDNGIGIPEENLTKIFMQGFTTRKGGHGFGLHGSANLAKEMNGALTAQSDGFDKGATFTLELPLQPPTKS